MPNETATTISAPITLISVDRKRATRTADQIDPAGEAAPIRPHDYHAGFGMQNESCAYYGKGAA